MKDIKSHSTDDIIDELYVRGYFLANDGYDYVDSCLFEDIVSVFDSLSCAKRAELRDLVITNFK